MTPPSPKTAQPRCPLPDGTVIYLVCLPRGWRGELRDGPVCVEARGADPHAGREKGIFMISKVLYVPFFFRRGCRFTRETGGPESAR
jgi:hypothetical protein